VAYDNGNDSTGVIMDFTNHPVVANPIAMISSEVL
jgi:hypothetical protein